MRRLPGVIFSAAAILLSGTALVPSTPAQAAFSFNINFGFNTFHDRLVSRGRWIRSPIWGDVWQPGRRFVGYDFQPYTNGYWEYTDEYGWYWVSDDPFDDVVYHYGRWVYDPDLNWVWIPGYTWGPGWVVWREGGGYSGWMPMPPDEEFVSGNGLSLGMNFGSWDVNFYGYNRWYGSRVDPGRFWVFVDNRNLANRDYRRFVVPRERARVLITNTRNVTKFEVVNNRVVNRSVDVKVIERASGRRIAPVAAKTVIKPNAIVTTVDESNRIRERERAQHPIRADFVKGGAGAGGNPGNATGRPGGATTGGQQPSGETGANKEHGPGSNGGAGNAMGSPPTSSPNGQGENPKNDKGSRGSRNPAGGTASGPSDTGAGTETGGPASEKPKHERDNNTATGGAMTGPSDNAATTGGPEKPKRDRNNNATTGGAMTSPSDNAATTGGPEKPKRDHNNNATTGGAMTGPAGGASGATSPGDNTAPSTGQNPERATRGPRSITPADNTMGGPSGNAQSPSTGPKHRTQGETQTNGPGGAPPSATGAPQPDNNAPKKKPKHNPPDTTPDSGTPQ